MYKQCEDKDCKEWYPYYGLAPHTHRLVNGSFIGSTVLEDKTHWPLNFVEDKESTGCGVYYCPKCFNGIKTNEGGDWYE